MATKNDWLAAASFEQAHEVASAINTLSIHAKLVLDGIADPTPAEDVQQARQRLSGFLARLQAVLADVQRAGAVVGADPQLGDVALRFLSRQQGPLGKRETPRLLVELAALIESERPADLRRLVAGLQELRSLLDVHAPSEPVQLVDR
jgi:hypothetical protein